MNNHQRYKAGMASRVQLNVSAYMCSMHMQQNIFTCSTSFSYLIVTIQHGSGAFYPTASGNLILGFQGARCDLAWSHPVRVLESFPWLYEELLSGIFRVFKELSCVAFVALAYQKIWSLQIQLDELMRKEFCVGKHSWRVVHWHERKPFREGSAAVLSAPVSQLSRWYRVVPQWNAGVGYSPNQHDKLFATSTWNMFN